MINKIILAIKNLLGLNNDEYIDSSEPKEGWATDNGVLVPHSFDEPPQLDWSIKYNFCDTKVWVVKVDLWGDVGLLAIFNRDKFQSEQEVKNHCIENEVGSDLFNYYKDDYKLIVEEKEIYVDLST